MGIKLQSLIIDGKDYTNDVKSISFIDRSDSFEYLFTLPDVFVTTPTSTNAPYSFTVNDLTITENDGYVYEIITNNTNGTTIRFRKFK